MLVKLHVSDASVAKDRDMAMMHQYAFSVNWVLDSQTWEMGELFQVWESIIQQFTKKQGKHTCLHK